MMKQLEKKAELLVLDVNYKSFLSQIKERLKTAQIRAALAANNEMIHFYWQLGSDLIEKQKAFKWGDNFLAQFSQDMREANPGMQGFSVRNLYRMKKMVQLYPDFQFLPQAVAKLPWGHIAVLIQTVVDPHAREWYAEQTIKNGWSRSILEMQIKSGLHDRQGISNHKITNYHEHLPAPQSDLANVIL